MVAIGSDSAEIFRLERKHFPHRHTRSAAVCVRVVLCKCVVLRLWKSGREVTDIAVFSTFSATIKVLFDLRNVIGSFAGEAVDTLFLSAPMQSHYLVHSESNYLFFSPATYNIVDLVEYTPQSDL